MDLSSKFAELASRNEKALVLFVTAGDPPLSELPAVLQLLQDAGADVIELGIPFSDPIADGPVIQASSQRALDRGTTPLAVLQALSHAKITVPVVLMTYYNPVLRVGLDRFASQAREAGASGVIVTDLTAEEADPWIAAASHAGLDRIFLAAPTSTDERLNEVCRRSTGFVYCVSRTGVTGAAESVPAEVSGLVSRLKARTSIPVCVGFGITKPEHVRNICSVADGAVVGTWLVQLLHEKWQGGEGAEEIAQQVREMKQATRL